MNLHRASEHDELAQGENYDRRDSRKEEYAPNTYAQEFRWLGSHAIDPEVRDEYLRLAEMFE